MKTMVIGVGNSFFSDDGVGPKLVNLFEDFIRQKRNSQNLFLKGCEVSALVVESIDPFAASKCRGFDRVVIVDAAMIDNLPGQCAVFNSQEIEDSFFLRGTHNFSALDLARMIEKQENSRLCRKVDLFCVRPKKLEFGESLSAELKNSLPDLLEKLVLCVMNRENKDSQNNYSSKQKQQ
ncbi:MAG: hydrogenase maturation protease [Candidatus Diapherotrites archaeon]|nr:hydrogenase maturation protease [Candidatus Diapherotrites archaeon]